MTYPSSTRWSINHPRVVHEILDDEAVMIDLTTGTYYSLDRVGTDVWAMIEKGAAADDIIRGIGRRYDGDRREVERGVAGLIDELRQEGLIAAGGTHAEERDAALAERDDAGFERRRFEAPVLRKYTDMQELILMDPIHEVDVAGWPNRKPENER